MRRTLLILVSLASAFGCTNQGNGPSAAALESELAMRGLIAAWERGDEALIADLFAPQATYDDFPGQQSYEGLGEIIGYITEIHDWADDVYMNVGQLHMTETGAVAEWVLSAIQARPMGVRLPTGTGREIVVNGVTIIEMEGGRIIRAADYVDTLPMMLQLGGRVEMPGGGVIELDAIG